MGLLVGCFLGCICLSGVLTGMAVWIARRKQLVTHPVERSSHTIPTPQIGGLGICFAALIAFFLLPSLAGWDSDAAEILLATRMFRWKLIVLLVSGMTLGLIDDLLHLSAWKKLSGMILVGLTPFVLDLIHAGGGDILGVLWQKEFWVNACISSVWIVFFMNAFNFMDGTNGQSGTFAVIVIGWWMVYTAIWVKDMEYPQVVRTTELLFLCILGACVLGFLPWNFPKASTFMGDSGSLPLGAALALFLCAGPASASFDACIAYGLALSPFLYDVFYTLGRRLSRGENLIKAHRGHLYQRLLIATRWSHARLLAFHLPVYLLCGLAGYFYLMGTERPPSPYSFGAIMGAPVADPSFFKSLGLGVAGFVLFVYTILVLFIEARCRAFQDSYQE